MLREKYNSITISDELLNNFLINPSCSQQLPEFLQGALTNIYCNRKTPQRKQKMNFSPSIPGKILNVEQVKCPSQSFTCYKLIFSYHNP